MLISDEYDFLFIHIPKCAGLSVTSLLEPYSYPRERSFLRRTYTVLPFGRNVGLMQLPIHATAPWAQGKLGSAHYSRLHSFAIVREPADRIISLYEYIRRSRRHHRNREVGTMDFSQFIEDLVTKHGNRTKRQVDFVCDDTGRIIVDRIMRFENLEHEVRTLWRDLGLPGAPELGCRNKSERRARETYLDPASRKSIETFFAKDYEVFSY